MQTTNTEGSAAPRPTVFLSYASEDRRAAQLIRDALPDFGLEVWYDESDLVGGDAWDQKIRRQIRECDYFMPVISAHTEARHEGYFRREWRLAVERTLDMADDHVFLLPVVIDQTAEAGARVPEKFRAVQWLRIPGGQPTPALEALCRRLVSGGSAPPPSGERARPARAPGVPPPGQSGGAPALELPPFPREEPGQRLRFWFQVAGWSLQCGWAVFRRLPKWVRILAYVWLLYVLVARGCTPSHDHRPPAVSAAQEQKLKEIGAGHSGNWTAADTAQLIAQVAKEIPAEAADESSRYAPVLAIPFAAPTDDAAAQKLAGAVFTQVYGRLAIARHGQVALAEEPLPALNASAALAQAHAHGSSYVVCGAVTSGTLNPQLTVEIIAVADGSRLWSRSYPLSGADPADIAAQVSARVPRHTDD
jgi:TolB-like protein